MSEKQVYPDEHDLSVWCGEWLVKHASTANPPPSAEEFGAFIARKAREQTAREYEGIRKFALACVDCAFEGNDTEGGEIQDLAETYGLLVRRPSQIVPCSESCRCCEFDIADGKPCEMLWIAPHLNIKQEEGK